MSPEHLGNLIAWGTDPACYRQQAPSPCQQCTTASAGGFPGSHYLKAFLVLVQAGADCLRPCYYSTTRARDCKVPWPILVYIPSLLYRFYYYRAVPVLGRVGASTVHVLLIAFILGIFVFPFQVYYPCTVAIPGPSFAVPHYIVEFMIVEVSTELQLYYKGSTAEYLGLLDQTSSTEPLYYLITIQVNDIYSIPSYRVPIVLYLISYSFWDSSLYLLEQKLI